MTSPTLTFLGAAGTVTGSRFRIDAAGGSVLVDAGLYQGPVDLRRRNWVPDDGAASLAAVVVTHAHLDHCGYLPCLVRDGFTGRIVCTPDTAELVAIVLRDSAHLQEEDARHANERGFSKHRPALPLYDAADVERTLALVDPVGYGEETRLLPGVTATLQPAGHILGSASAVLDVDGERLVVSGDLGRPRHPLLRPPAPVPATGTVVVESTYGDRTHEPAQPHLLADAVRRTVGRGGCVLVPAFAVDRTELVLMELHRLVAAGEVPRVPVFLDSPMALATLEVYRRAVVGGSPQLRPEARELLVALDALHVRPAADAAESIRLNNPTAPCIVVSASGMATGGRVVHHLAEQLPDPRNCVVLTGYQAIGTRGRQLLDGATQLKIHGRYVPVRAEVVDDPDFSVHADGDELLAWLATAPEPPRTAYVVHGEEHGSSHLAARIRAELGWTAVVPRLGEVVRLD
ncbi:MAG: MBL fold metallo-hydrolase [Nocardioides sp.]|nr:MBL fold metallo-hydrolase [Nocardioidaceae bacterium]MCB8957946.1 MBL fold metallo-hydrolase [Nocardioides sp.]